jgi:type III secretion protein T
MILPLLSKDDAPGLVRNAIYLSLSLSIAPFLSVSGPLPVEAGRWALLIAKEIFVGLGIGFLFSIMFWAIAMVGDIIDTKAGATQGTLSDPLSGHQVSISSAFLGRFTSWLFIAFGGLLLFLEVLLGSYVVWPVLTFVPDFKAVGTVFFAQQFGSMMLIAFLLAAPVLVVLSTIDFALGMINRYVPQLNVLPIAMGLKAWISTAMILFGLAVFIDYFLHRLKDGKSVLTLLKTIF